MEGKEVVAIDKPSPAAAPTDLMAALKQSLAQMEGKKKGPQRVEAAQRESEVEVKGKQKSVAGKEEAAETGGVTNCKTLKHGGKEESEEIKFDK